MYQRSGFLLMDKDQNFSSEFAFHFGKHANAGFVELDEKEKDRWLEGYDLDLSVSNVVPGTGKEAFKNILFVKYGRFCLGWGKIMNQGDKLKNKLNRDLVF